MKNLVVFLSFIFLGCSNHDSSSRFAFEVGSPWPKFRGNAVQDGTSAILNVVVSR